MSEIQSMPMLPFGSRRLIRIKGDRDICSNSHFVHTDLAENLTEFVESTELLQLHLAITLAFSIPATQLAAWQSCLSPDQTIAPHRRQPPEPHQAGCLMHQWTISWRRVLLVPPNDPAQHILSRHRDHRSHAPIKC